MKLQKLIGMSTLTDKQKVEILEALQIKALNSHVSVELAFYLQYRKLIIMARLGRTPENEFVKPSFIKNIFKILWD